MGNQRDWLGMTTDDPGDSSRRYPRPGWGSQYQSDKDDKGFSLIRDFMWHFDIVIRAMDCFLGWAHLGCFMRAILSAWLRLRGASLCRELVAIILPELHASTLGKDIYWRGKYRTYSSLLFNGFIKWCFGFARAWKVWFRNELLSRHIWMGKICVIIFIKLDDLCSLSCCTSNLIIQLWSLLVKITTGALHSTRYFPKKPQLNKQL